MTMRLPPRVVLLAAALAAVLGSAACARRVAWTPVTSYGLLPVEVDATRIRAVDDGVIEVWMRELHPPAGSRSVRERRMKVELNCTTQQFRLIDVYLLRRDGRRHRDSVTADAFFRPTPEGETDRPWLAARRLPFRADEVCAQWGAGAERPALRAPAAGRA
jgi:hypothetical protein